MKNLIITIILATFVINIASAQCKFKPFPKRLSKLIISEVVPNHEVSTKIKILFDRLSFNSSFSFVKSGDDYYFFNYLWRRNSKKYSISENDFMKISTMNGDSITIYPNGVYTGKRILNVFVIGCYYKISKEQIEILANSKIDSLKIKVTSEKKIIGGPMDAGGWNQDENGSMSYSTTVSGANKKNNLLKSAQCFLGRL